MTARKILFSTSTDNSQPLKANENVGPHKLSLKALSLFFFLGLKINVNLMQYRRYISSADFYRIIIKRSAIFVPHISKASLWGSQNAASD